MTTTITIKNLSKHFGNVAAVNNVSLTIDSGSFLTLLGPSGCGKTTLLYLLAGLRFPTAGQVLFELDAAPYRIALANAEANVAKQRLHRNVEDRPGRVNLPCVSLRGLIRMAYRSGKIDSRPIEVLGGPGWVKSDRYQISARAEDNASVELMTGPMFRTLLDQSITLRVAILLAKKIANALALYLYQMIYSSRYAKENARIVFAGRHLLGAQESNENGWVEPLRPTDSNDVPPVSYRVIHDLDRTVMTA